APARADAPRHALRQRCDGGGHGGRRGAAPDGRGQDRLIGIKQPARGCAGALRRLYFCPEPGMDAGHLEARKTRARTWFESLRDESCTAFEAIEDALPENAPFADRDAGRFLRTPWQRTISGLPETGNLSAGPAKAGPGGGGGVMALMRGRVFEKVGVHCST